MPLAPIQVWFAALAVACGLGAFAYLVAGRRPKSTARQILTGERNTSARDVALERSGIERLFDFIITFIRDFGSRVTPMGVVSETDRRIAFAGMSDRWTADRFIAAKGLASLSVFLVWFLFAVTRRAPLLILLGAGIAVIVFFLPDLLLLSRGKSRSQKIREQLADVADQILIAVEAGASLDTAIVRVTQGTDGPLQQEFRRMLQDVTFGLSRRDALIAMVARTSVPELREMLLAIAQSEEHGLSIGKILRVQAGEIREKRRTRAEEAAMKVPVKIVIPLVLFIMPCLLAIIIGPAVVRISENLNF